MEAIRVERLVKRFGRLRAVDGVDLIVPRGATFGLIGPNGAGKTTLFGMVCGWLRPSAGHVSVLGKPPWQAVHLKGRLAALPQDAALPPNTSVLHSLTYYARLQGHSRKKAAEEARRVLELVGLPEAASRRASRLSHGMAKRVGLAQAFIGSPELILLDEPTSGLDPKSAHLIRALMSELRGEATVVVSSHNLHELETICDYAAILDRGKLVAQGTMAELTAADSEVLITLGGSSAPAADLIAAASSVPGVATASHDPGSGVLTVRFASAGEEPEELVTSILSALIASGGKIGTVSRGRGLEQKVLSVT